MYLYLSAPMTGKPCNNKALFADAQGGLEAAGHNVTSPADLDHNEDLSRDATPEEYEQYLARDLDLVAQHEAIVFLPGWEESGGAGREGRHALAFGLRMFEWFPSHPHQLYPLDPDEFRRRHTIKRAEAVNA